MRLQPETFEILHTLAKRPIAPANIQAGNGLNRAHEAEAGIRRGPLICSRRSTRTKKSRLMLWNSCARAHTRPAKPDVILLSPASV